MNNDQLSPLYIDLSRNADDRLDTWLSDTLMRCEIGRMSKPDAICLVLSNLLAYTTGLCKALGMKREDFLILAQQAYNESPAQPRKKFKQPR